MIGVKQDFDDSLGEGDTATLRGDRRRARRRAHRAQGRRLVALQDQQRLPMVQFRRALELRAGQVLQAHRRRDDRHRRRQAGQIRRPGRLGPPSARHQVAPTAKRPASPSTSAGAGTASADTPDNVVVTLDKASYAPGEEAKLRIASRYRGQGDGRAGRRQARAVHRRRSRRRRQRRALQGRRRLGRGRLCGRASPIARSTSRPSACRAARSASPGSASTRTRASSTSRSRRPTRRGRARR